MGTRADFYIRQDGAMKWIGSKAWDGYPEGIKKEILTQTTSEGFEGEVTQYLKQCKDGTLPEQGWPWPWNDSRTTDYSYIFENGKVMASNWGYPLFDPLATETDEDDGERDIEKMEGFFPDMSAVKNVDFGDRSGIIIFTPKQ